MASNVALNPIYTPAHVASPAFSLRYDWTGWPSSTPVCDEPATDFWDALLPLWEQDGVRLLERSWRTNLIHLTFSAKPQVAPTLLAARAKGRLQHAIRRAGRPTDFSRKVSVRSVGKNCTDDVLRYVAGQTAKEECADPRFREMLKQFTIRDDSVDLSKPSETSSGRCWYNLHLVLVVRERFRFGEAETLTRIRDSSFAIARKKGHQIASLSVLPDHLHTALRGNIEKSPEEIALGFMNNLAYSLGQNAVWQYGYYAGTFGEYDMKLVRG